MKNNTIYFVAEKEISEDEILTGIKDITIYKVENNIPMQIAEIQSLSDDRGAYFKTEIEEVQDYLDEFNPEYAEWEIQRL